MRESRQSNAVIAIVDDDRAVRRGLERLTRSVGWKAETFASSQEGVLPVRGLLGKALECAEESR